MVSPATRDSMKVRCPECGSADVAKAPRAVYADRLFVVSAPYKCRACNRVFFGPCSLVVCFVGVAVGALFLLAGALGTREAFSSLDLLLAAGQWRHVFSLLEDALGAIGAICMGVYIVYVSATSAISSSGARR